MMSILKFILRSSCLLFLPHSLYAQTIPQAKDTVLTNGVRIGVDLGKIAYYFLTEKAHRTFEASADIGYKKMIFVAEAGFSDIALTKTDIFSYKSNGLFARIGIETNLLKGGDDAVFVGARYGVSQFGFRADNILLPDAYYGDATTSVSKQNATAQWIEGVGGVKVNVFSNIYIGFTGRLKIKVAESSYQQMDAIYIPGFGKADKNITIGLSYYIFYRIPFKNKSELKIPASR